MSSNSDPERLPRRLLSTTRVIRSEVLRSLVTSKLVLSDRELPLMETILSPAANLPSLSAAPPG